MRIVFVIMPCICDPALVVFFLIFLKTFTEGLFPAMFFYRFTIRAPPVLWYETFEKQKDKQGAIFSGRAK